MTTVQSPERNRKLDAKAPDSEKKEEDTPESKAASSRRTWISFAIIVAFLAVLFFAIMILPGIIRANQLQSNKYNGFEFAKDSSGYWYTMIEAGNQTYQVPVYYHPRDLESIPVEVNLRQKFFDIRANNGSIFITLDPDSTDNKIVIAGTEISKITGTRYGVLNVPTKAAFIKKPSNATTNSVTPIVTCSIASNRTMVIWLTLSDKDLVYSDGYCVILEAKDYNETIKVADRLVYHILGIMTD